MPADYATQRAVLLTKRMLIAAVAACILSAALLITAAVASIRTPGAMEAATPASLVRPQRRAHAQEIARRVTALQGNIAGRALLQPTNAQAAVKDDGAAARLLKRLKLRGVVKMGPQFVAYVQIRADGRKPNTSKRVRAGDHLGDLRVEKIEPGKVLLTFESMQAMLTN